MAGLYIHIPYCRRACHYCNFHFSTQLDSLDQMVKEIATEIQHKAYFLENKKIETIYFGGGTPSLLSKKHLELIVQSIDANYRLEGLKEFTLEANPEDISRSKLEEWQSIGLNRLSIGVQSFFDEDLIYMNRIHDAKTSRKALDLCKTFGPDRISIDLIFGSHTTTHQMWEENLSHFLSYDFDHLSAYGLTVEENTVLSRHIEKGKLPKTDDDKSSTQFIVCMDTLSENGYLHYEISNYAKPDCTAVHNTNYWKGVPYLGIGPSAHSFDGKNRYWSVANNQKYLKQAAEGKFDWEKENLSLKDQYNEWVMTGLRYQGLSPEVLSQKYQEFSREFNEAKTIHLEKGNLLNHQGRLHLSQTGKLIADDIISDFFATE